MCAGKDFFVFNKTCQLRLLLMTLAHLAKFNKYVSFKLHFNEHTMKAGKPANKYKKKNDCRPGRQSWKPVDTHVRTCSSSSQQKAGVHNRSLFQKRMAEYKLTQCNKISKKTFKDADETVMEPGPPLNGGNVPIIYVLSLGTPCYPALFLRQKVLHPFSGPFDFIFSSLSTF